MKKYGVVEEVYSEENGHIGKDNIFLKKGGIIFNMKYALKRKYL